MKNQNHIYLLIALAFVIMAASYIFMPQFKEENAGPSQVVLEYLADIKYDLRSDEFNLSPVNYDIINVRWMRDLAEVKAQVNEDNYIFYLTLKDKKWQVISVERYEEEIPEPKAQDVLNEFYENILMGDIEKDFLIEKLKDKDIDYFVCPTTASLFHIEEQEDKENETVFRIYLLDEEDYGQAFVRLIKEEGLWLISSVTCVAND
jgi:hypothetical protein